MNADILARSLIWSVFFVLLGSGFGWKLVGWEWAASYAWFGFWCICNFVLIGHTIKALFNKRAKIIVAALVFANMTMVAVLILSAAILSHYKQFNVLAFLLGFHTPFIVLVLKALGAQLTGALKEEKKTVESVDQTEN